MPKSPAPQFQSHRIAGAAIARRNGDGAAEIDDAQGGATHLRVADDRVEQGFTLGRQAFEKISAVEGIRLTRAMKRDLLDARTQAGSAEEARSILAAKYGRKDGRKDGRRP